MPRSFPYDLNPSEPAMGILVIVMVCIGVQAADETRRNSLQPNLAEAIKVSGIENVYKLSPRLYSGGQPEGPESLAALKKLGIKTIVSVDGSVPNVEAARALGFRYVHLPVGYEGISRGQAIRIVKATRMLPGPVFIHCHHGKHRGPAAAAVCSIAIEGWSKNDAIAWMKQAGTSPDYRGLFSTVSDFVVPSSEELAKADNNFPERAETPALVDLMVAIDGSWDRLKMIREGGFKTSAIHPDIDPPHEALQLAEQFKELARQADSKARGEDFIRKAEASAQLATTLKERLSPLRKNGPEESRKSIEEAFMAVGKTCMACHVRYRDNQ